MAQFEFETKLVKNKICHYYLQENGFKFRRKERKPSGVAYFICMHDICKAKLSAKYDVENLEAEPTITKIPLDSDHDHMVDGVDKLIAEAKRRIRKRIEGDPFVMCMGVYEEVIREIREEIGNDVVTLELFTARMSTYKSMSSSMYRWRDMYLPPEPTKQEDILLNHSFSKIGDESIILGDTITQGSDDGMIVFGHNKLLKVLENTTRICADATFDIVPKKLFYQLFIMFALVANSAWIPCIYVLMSNKEEYSYKQVYDKIEMCLALHPDGPIMLTQPLEVMMDFEKGMRTPWAEKFTNHRLRGCMFHFCQAIFRKFQNTGGIEMLARFPAILGILYMVYALPLTPPDCFDEAWRLFDEEIQSVSYNNEPLRDYLLMLIGYVRTTWFQAYHPDDWNHYCSASYEWLTNNVSESGNARLKKKHSSPNPGLFIKLE